MPKRIAHMQRRIAAKRPVVAEQIVFGHRVEPRGAGRNVDADRTRRPEAIAVLVAGGVQQDRTRCRWLRSVASRLLEAAGDYDAGVRSRMAMARQAAPGDVARLAQREERRRCACWASAVDVGPWRSCRVSR